MSADATPGQDDPGGFDYADEWVGDVPNELTPEQEAYRAEAYEKVLHYARDYGLAIFTVYGMKNSQACACVQGELCDPKAKGKHPYDLRWPESATSDPEQAARWWRPLAPGEEKIDWRPTANVGTLLGERHFLFDVDTDGDKQGSASQARLEREGGEELPATLTYQTGGGGRGRIMAIPPGTEVRSSASKIAPDIDIKSIRSYGILPPSRSGKGEYLMLDDRSPDVQPPGWLSDWFREQHRGRTEHIRRHPCGDPRQIPADGLTKRAHAYLTSAFKDAVATVAAAPDGKRNQALNDECFDMFAKFVPAGLLSADDVAAAMQEAGESCGLEPKAVYATIESARGGGQRKDRSSELPEFLFAEPGDEDQDRSGGRFLPHPGQPIKTARVLAAADLATEQGLPSLRWHRGGFTRWDGSAWLSEPDSAVEQQLYLICEHAKYEERDEDDDGEGVTRVRSWNPSPSSIAPLMKILGVAVLQLPHRLNQPFWITAGAEERELIPVGNGLLNARTRELMPHSADFYNSWSLPYDFDPDAGEPKEWLKFIGELWPDEPDSIDFLQELCGNLVSGETDQQKVPLFHGAPRGGKGTVVRVLTCLLGTVNVTTPTFANLMEPFGLEPLLNKPLAVISDMRVGGKGIQAAVERLLTISGGDMSTVHRKNKTALEVLLPTRFLLVSNELFALKDAATALVSRTIPLAFSRSWLGREDRGLAARLTTPEELTKILNWCLAGLDRLHRQGRFTMPENAEETLAELEGLASPVKAWARDNCDLGPEYSDRLETLHGSFEAWAIKQRMTVIPEAAIFARNLRAAYPGIKVTRPRSGDDEKRPRVYTGIRAHRGSL